MAYFTIDHFRAIKSAVKVLFGRRETAQDIYDGYIEWGYDAFTSECAEDFSQTNSIISIVFRAAKLRGLR
jgi:hypothetical protein